MAVMVSAVNWLDRYRAGQRDEVWHELRQLGSAVREPGLVEEAQLVCDEMARRARADGLFAAETTMPFVSYLNWVFSNGGFPARTFPYNRWQMKQELARDPPAPLATRSITSEELATLPTSLPATMANLAVSCLHVGQALLQAVSERLARESHERLIAAVAPG